MFKSNITNSLHSGCQPKPTAKRWHSLQWLSTILLQYITMSVKLFLHGSNRQKMKYMTAAKWCSILILFYKTIHSLLTLESSTMWHACTRELIVLWVPALVSALVSVSIAVSLLLWNLEVLLTCDDDFHLAITVEELIIISRLYANAHHMLHGRWYD